MSIPKWNRKPCIHCGGSGNDPKKRSRSCTKCSGSGNGHICADCNKRITGTGNFEDRDHRCVCQDIPYGAI